MSREKALHEKAVVFVRHHLGKHTFGPLTGTDWRAWRAFVYLVELYACGDHGTREHALEAMRSVVASAQQSAGVLENFVQVIPSIMDWGDDARIWPRVVEGQDGLVEFAGLRAVDRPYDFHCKVCHEAGFGKHKCRGRDAGVEP